MKKFKLTALLLLLALLPFSAAPQLAQQTQATATARAAKLSSATIDAAKQITAARLSEHLHVVASDAMEGRDTPSRGLDATANYIADDLKKLGIKPAGDDGTYFQRIALKRDKVDPTRTAFSLGDTAFTFGDDFITAGATGAAEGPLVFVGHGWIVKSKNIDAYKGIDVRDKIMVVAGTGLPPGVTRADTRGKVGVDYEDPDSYGRRNGARGIIYAPRPRGGDMARWWQFMRSAAQRGGGYRVERFGGAGSSSLPAVHASQKLLDAIFAGEKVSSADVMKQALGGEAAPTLAAFALSPQKRAKFSAALTTETATTQNVVGILEGRDARLKSEYVALGAHYDHIGVAGQGSGQCPDAGADKICNGADDDGSGTVSILTIAEAFAKGPRPKRSILFVWHCGEEKGLWGSQYFTNYPTVPLANVITQLNIDMIGRSRKAGDTNPLNANLSGPNEVYVIGSKMMSTDLGALSERINASYLNLSFNYKYDDPHDTNRFFFRSDHFNYAQKGIPIIFYFDGVHEDYHRPGDEPDKIDYQKMEKVARTVFATATELANSQARPRVDKQLPQELTGR
jgi:Zn-dependent M28 family amino/carboxypeptidase